MKNASPPKKPEPLDAVKLFNEFQSQSRERAESTLKLIIGISGAMLSLSVGALLSATPAKIPAQLLCSLQWGVGMLFFSIAASILLMASMIVATFHMGIRWQKTLQSPGTTFEFVATWNWLRVANGVLAFLVLCCFLLGISLLAQVAVGVVLVETPTPMSKPLLRIPSANSASSATIKMQQKSNQPVNTDTTQQQLCQTLNITAHPQSR